MAVIKVKERSFEERQGWFAPVIKTHDDEVYTLSDDGEVMKGVWKYVRDYAPIEDQDLRLTVEDALQGLVAEAFGQHRSRSQS